MVKAFVVLFKLETMKMRKPSSKNHAKNISISAPSEKLHFTKDKSASFKINNPKKLFSIKIDW
jgi:hypothetical protein